MRRASLISDGLSLGNNDEDSIKPLCEWDVLKSAAGKNLCHFFHDTRESHKTTTTTTTNNTVDMCP